MKNKKILRRFNIWRLKHLSEGTFILLLSVIIGISVGLMSMMLKSGVYYLREFIFSFSTKSINEILLFIFPVIGIALTIIFKKYIIRDTKKHNVSAILYAISKRNSLMKLHKTFSSVTGAALTAGFGGSIGLESPIISTGSAIGSGLGRMLHLNYKHITLLLVCGAAGGVASIFNTPVAAVVFALEVLLIDLTRFYLIPILVSSVSGAMTNRLLLDDNIFLNFKVNELFTFADIPFYILLGILAGGVSLYFTRTFLFIETKFEGYKNFRKRLLFGGAILGLLIFLFPPLYGEGYFVIEKVINGETSFLFENSLLENFSNSETIVILVMFVLIFVKVIATGVTIGAGGIGGIFAPSMFTGAFLGLAFAKIINFIGLPYALSENNFALVGMAALLAGVLHAPLTGIFLIAELTKSYELMIPLMLTVTVAYVTVKTLEPHSIFTKHLHSKGELLTHHKDKAVLHFIDLKNVIEKEFLIIHPSDTLGELVSSIKKSKRNIFPVIDKDNHNFLGVVLLENVREIMFDTSNYNDVIVSNLMTVPPVNIYINDRMDVIAEKFNKSNAWNLPVVDENNKYIGFVSKSKLFTVYRKQLLEMSEE